MACQYSQYKIVKELLSDERVDPNIPVSNITS